MNIHDVPALNKGCYRIVPVSADENDPDRITAYAVLDPSGIRLRQELTLDDAKAWVERHDEEETPAPAVMHAQVKPARLRR